MLVDVVLQANGSTGMGGHSDPSYSHPWAVGSEHAPSDWDSDLPHWDSVFCCQRRLFVAEGGSHPQMVTCWSLPFSGDYPLWCSGFSSLSSGFIFQECASPLVRGTRRAIDSRTVPDFYGGLDRHQ